MALRYFRSRSRLGEKRPGITFSKISYYTNRIMPIRFFFILVFLLFFFYYFKGRDLPKRNGTWQSNNGPTCFHSESVENDNSRRGLSFEIIRDKAITQEVFFSALNFRPSGSMMHRSV